MDTIRSSLVTSASLYPQEVLDGIREALRLTGEKESRKKIEYRMPGILLGYFFGSCVRGGVLREREILTLSPKSLRVCQSRPVRTCVARVGHEADNYDMQNQESKFSFFYPNALITSP
jgi:hypothetical protein